ncbi:HAMP domain-containing sensor histidine kinase [Kyrpidia tusciae]|uniref:histidine kinase n=1 Tax=Kyrpidia tusciae (strain DSM 2912 / NBRC 15312 / T2) TaxID=562970 RepID=D5WTD2_KYRT2|nr:HAMP domain-containing sensor histidine kinase [Kyrpidia tusciae]ADG07168.1 multi-sensor signal transduction histidine kinase [Kyrpidia tusciae DSM 2912]
MGRSLSRRLVVMGFVLSAVAGLWTGLWVVRSEVRGSMSEVQGIAAREAALAAQDASMRWSEPVRLIGWAEQTAGLLDATCRVYGPDGRVIASSGETGGSADSNAAAQIWPGVELNRALDGETATDVQQNPVGRLVVRAASPVRAGDRILGVVWLETPLAQVVAPFGAWWAWLVGLGVSVSLGVAWSAVVARDIRTGLLQLRQAAAVWAQGRYHGLPFRRKDELGQVAEELAEMASALQRSTEDLAMSVEKLHLEKDRLEITMQHLVSGVMALDGRGRVEWINPAMAELIGEQRVIGRRFWGIQAFQPIYAMIDQAVRNGEGGRYDGVFGPARREVEVHVVPIPRIPGQGQEAGSTKDVGRPEGRHFLRGSSLSGGAVVIIHDVTERRRLEQVRKEFVTNVSHELKTPVTAICGLAETVVEEDLAPEERRHFLELIHREARRLEQLVRDLLDLSRLESHLTTLHRRPVDLAEMARDVVQDYGYAAEQAGTDLYLDKEGDCRAEVDPDRVRQVLSNLIDNALKYTPAGGRVDVRVLGTDPREVKVEVADTGVGIPPEDRDRVFERFYRVDKARARTTGGTGLGLAIVKHVVQLHGGRVGVESEVGKGSRFFVQFPRRWPPDSLP